MVISDPTHYVAYFWGNFVTNFRKKRDEFLGGKGGGRSRPKKIPLLNFWISGKNHNIDIRNQGREGGGSNTVWSFSENSSKFVNRVVPKCLSVRRCLDGGGLRGTESVHSLVTYILKVRVLRVRTPPIFVEF